MKATELKAGRTFGVTFQHGEDSMASRVGFCRSLVLADLSGRWSWWSR
jgi:hypothetical protein